MTMLSSPDGVKFLFLCALMFRLLKPKQKDQEQEAEAEGTGEGFEKKGGSVTTGQGHRIDYGPDCKILSTTRLCFYCSKEGKEHPIEHFVRYPCCGHFLCRECMQKNASFCGECLTQIPTDNTYAVTWILNHVKEPTAYTHLLGRTMVYGAHTYLDELVRKPVYEYKKLQPPSAMLALMNPPNVKRGVVYLEEAAKHEVIGAMLDLADVYCTDFSNDEFQKSEEKAEEWYTKALGHHGTLFPLAFTRYGDFLMWQQRSTEARDMYRVAAEFGHARGQYEYAACLISSASSADISSEGLIGDAMSYEDTMEEALQYLCKASEKGFYSPSYTAFAKVLAEIAEKAHGTVFSVGRSPIPRVAQILNVAMDTTRPRYGSSQEWEDETSKLLEHYECRKNQCSSCGQEESEARPLRLCGTCHSVAYCSKVCQKRDYRDGHKFDCCPRQELFNFQSLRYALPWVSKDGWKKIGQDLPQLSSTGERSLMKMIEDDTDELYGEDDQDVDEAVLVNFMFRMRKNLETYLHQELNLQVAKSPKMQTLKSKIDMFSKNLQDFPGREDFISAMHQVRILGNDAAHTSDSKLVQAECEQAVYDYRSQKDKYEQYRERPI